jgi:hypothetical protein
MSNAINLPLSDQSGPRPRGHFGNATVCGAFTPDASDWAATTSHFGLSLYMNTQYGTFRDATGTWYNAQRVVESELASGLGVYRAGDTNMMPEAGRSHTGYCGWRIEGGQHIIENHPAGVPLSGHNPDPGGWSSEPLRLVESSDHGVWHEGDILNLSGPLIAGFQWYVPGPDGGTYFTSHPHRASGTYLGEPVEGFFLHDQIYLPRGVNYPTSPFWSSVHIALVSGGTEYEDGTIEVFQIGLGKDRFAFALIANQDGVIHQTTNVSAVIDRDEKWFPTHIVWDVDGDQWEWIPDKVPELLGYSGELSAEAASIPGYRASEGQVRRVGDTRHPVAWMAYVEAFSDRG